MREGNGANWFALEVVWVRGFVNVDSIFALMIFLLFFAFVSNYVLQMSGRAGSTLDLRSAKEKAYLEVIGDGSLLDPGEQAPVRVFSEDSRGDYFWFKWENASLSVPSSYDPGFGEIVGYASLSQGWNEYVASNSAEGASGDIHFDGTKFANSLVNLSMQGMNVTELKLNGGGIASRIFLSPQPAAGTNSQTPLRVKVVGGEYSWSFFSNHSGFALEYEAMEPGLLNISILLEPSLTLIYTNGSYPCANFSAVSDFADAYGSGGIAVVGDSFSVSCSDGVLGITKQASVSGNESRVYTFRFYLHEGDYSNALKYGGVPVVISGLPFGGKLFSPERVAGIGSGYCESIRNSVNPNLGLWLSFRLGNNTYECKTDSPSSTQDVVVSKKAVTYSNGERGLLYARVWYR